MRNNLGRLSESNFMKKTYPKLYSRTSTGATQQWQIFVEDDSFYCVYGQVGGQLITGAKTVVETKNVGKKNEIGGHEQALKEADAEFLKKQSQKGYFLSIGDIDKETFFSPQLAKSWDDYKDDINLSKGGWCASAKLDGLRAIIKSDGCFSRNGKTFVSFPHIRELLQPIFDKFPDFIADGEIYQHSFKDNFNKIISLAKKSKPTTEDIEESAGLLEYWIFDCGSMPGKPFKERLEFIQKVVDEVSDHRIKFVSHDIVKSESEVEAKLAEYLEDGFEGAMLKNLEATYQNKRVRDVLKYKLFAEREFEVLDIIEGIGNRAGKFGRALLKTEAGREFEANARGDESYYIELLKNKKKYIGKQATVRFQNWTPGENPSPRFPVIIGIRDYE